MKPPMDFASATEILVARFANRRPLRAGALIVSLYGDIVLPRGGSLWMGTIIRICGRLGISETLVRTAVSRLVSAGTLEGVRDGRRSFYRLTKAARAEFMEASARIYHRPQRASDGDWTLVFLARSEIRAEQIRRLEEIGFAAIAGGAAMMFGDRRQQAQAALVQEAGAGAPLVFLGRPDELEDGASLSGLVADSWQLGDLEAGFCAFSKAFAVIGNLLVEGTDPEATLVARLLLVHEFRTLALKEPDLPQNAVPAGWAGDRARQLFCDLYPCLAGVSDPFADTTCENAAGPLGPAGALGRQRLRDLSI